MDQAHRTVLESINASFGSLTKSERRLADSLLANYPVSGLGSITTVAEMAGVSTPTVARMVQKLGFKGFSEFQASLRRELEATLSGPLAKRERMAAQAPVGHILNRFAEQAVANLRDTLEVLDPGTFDATAALLSDRRRSIHIVGGRITHALADYLFTHLQVIRPGTTLIGPAATWPHYVLDMGPRSVLVLFDIRRYENDLISLSEAARDRGARIVLLTDQWGSPVSRIADHVFNIRIEAPSAWDSSMVTLFVVEALIEAVQARMWDDTRQRIGALEGLFDTAIMFKGRR